MRKANIYMYDKLAGILVENDEGYEFSYDEKYLASKEAEAVSLTLPLSSTTYKSTVLFPFFDGLIPEGWLLDVAQKNWKFNVRDRMSILLATCQDCIGAVSIEEIK